MKELGNLLPTVYNIALNTSNFYEVVHYNHSLKIFAYMATWIKVLYFYL